MDKEILLKLTKEYVDMITLLRANYSEFIIERNDVMYVESELFNFLLEQKDFLKVKEKMKIWRNLRWLKTGTDRKRFSITVTVEGKTVRKYALETEPYEILKTVKFT